jgi:hypothetical protein
MGHREGRERDRRQFLIICRLTQHRTLCTRLSLGEPEQCTTRFSGTWNEENGNSKLFSSLCPLPTTILHNHRIVLFQFIKFSPFAATHKTHERHAQHSLLFFCKLEIPKNLIELKHWVIEIAPGHN